MDVRCGRCGTEYDFDDALISERGTTVQCTECGFQFKIYPRGPQAAQERWVVRSASDASREHEFRSLKELQRAIQRGDVGPADWLARDQGASRRLGAIEELEPFFRERPATRSGGTLVGMVPAPGVLSGPIEPPATEAMPVKRRVQTKMGIPSAPSPLPAHSPAPPPTVPASAAPAPVAPAPVAPAPEGLSEPTAPVTETLASAPAAEGSTTPVRREKPFAKTLPSAVQAEPPQPAPEQTSAGKSALSPAALAAQRPRSAQRQRIVSALSVVPETDREPHRKSSWAGNTLQSMVHPGFPIAASREPEPSPFEQEARREGATPAPPLDVSQERAPERLDQTLPSDVGLPAFPSSPGPLQPSPIQPVQGGQSSEGPFSQSRSSEIQSSEIQSSMGPSREGHSREGHAWEGHARPERSVASATQESFQEEAIALPRRGRGPWVAAMALAAAAALAAAWNWGWRDEPQIRRNSSVPEATTSELRPEALSAPAQPSAFDEISAAPSESSQGTLEVAPAPRERTSPEASEVTPTAPARSAPGQTDYRDRLMAANQAAQAGDSRKAEQLYESVLRDQPGNTEALAGLAELAEQRGERQTAAQLYEEVLATNPSYVPALMGRGDQLWAAGERSKALEHYQRVIERVGTSGYYGQRAQSRIEQSQTNSASPETTDPDE